MSTPPSTPEIGTAPSRKSRKPPRRQPLSCLPCRQHKLRCDRHIPCGTCSRYRREDVCRLHPAPPRGRSRQQTANASGAGALNANELDPRDRLAAASTSGLSYDARQHNGAPQESVQLVGHVHMESAAQAMTSSLAAQRGGIPAAPAYSPAVASDATILFPQILPLLQLQASTLDPLTLLSTTNQANLKLPWTRLLVKLLPTRTQSDILFSYFVEHINWIFQTVHIPSFRKDYARLWDARMEDVDLTCLSLLFTIISLSALYIPIHAVEFVGLDGDTVRQLAHLWHHASLQALQAGNYEAKPTLTQLQTFSVTQLYWYATNNIEILNSRMAQAIRHAQVLGLDKDSSPSKNVEDEMRHRLWWDLVDSDTFQSVCLERAPLIQVRFTNVPLPLNCNDIDLGADFVHPKPGDEPTSMSMNIYRAKIFQIINKALVSDPAQFKCLNAVIELDRQLLDVMEKLPWFFQLDAQGKAKEFPASYDFLIWQHHILRTCVSTQRIRMYRPFLAEQSGLAWANCLSAVEDAMAVYRPLRKNMSSGMQQKFLAQAYQIFSVAVTMVTILLVERSMPHFSRFKSDVEIMTADLGLVDAQACPVPVAVNGRKVLLKMLALLEQGCSPEDAERLVPDISIIIGGENTTRAYLGRRETQESSSVSRRATQPTSGRVQGSLSTAPAGPVQHEQLHDSANRGLHNHELNPGATVTPTTSDAVLSASTYGSIIPNLGDAASVSIPFPDPSDFSFDFGDFQLSDSYDLFGWDMTGLLSGAVTSANRLRTEEEMDSVLLS